MIRKRIKLSPEKAIFIFVDEVLPPTAALMSSIYEEHKDEDGYVINDIIPGWLGEGNSMYADGTCDDRFLYISYSGENTFGSCEEMS